MPLGEEEGRYQGSSVTENGERTLGTSLLITESGRHVWGIFAAPWTLAISKGGSVVAEEPYETQPTDLDWVPPANPGWGERGGRYDYEWIPN